MLKLILSVFAALLVLFGCGGGGGDSGSGGGGGGGSVTPASIEVLSSDTTLQSAGTGVTITAFVKNSSNVAMPNQPVTISSSSGALQNVSTTTNASGVATANLSVGANKSNRTIRVTVSSGTASGFIDLSVVGTQVILTGDAAVQQGSTATYSVRVLDSAGNPIQNASVSLTSSRNNTLSPNPALTNSSGIASITYTAVNATTPGNPDVLTASALGASAKLDIVVSNVQFRFLTPSAGTNVVLGAVQPLTVQYRVGGLPGAGNVNFTTTRGLINGASSATVALGPTGEASVNLTSGTSGPGPVTVLAQIPGVVQAPLQLNFVSVTPATIVAQANPAAIQPNSGGSTLSQSTIEATVRDADNNPVAGRQVNFTIDSDSSGGNLSSPSALTDQNGKAQVQYIAGTTSTGANGVSIRASVDGTAIDDLTELTVNGQALFITIGFGNEISNLDSTTYSKPFSVFVTDATGNPVSGRSLSISVIPDFYLKGELAFDNVNEPNAWRYAAGSPTVACLNTDINRNGIADPGESSPLMPGNVVTAVPATVTTDASGRAVFDLRYGENYVPWLSVSVTARTTVAGTESSRTLGFFLTGDAGDFTDGNVNPAGRISPFNGADEFVCP